jgi:hypothetical protein
MIFSSQIAPAIAVSALLSILAAPASDATILLSFDRFFTGDDPTESFSFDQAFDPTVPAELRFNGFVENHDGSETGVRFMIRWQLADQMGTDGIHFPDDEARMGVGLPPVDPVLGVIRVPLEFSAQPGFSPAVVTLTIEGLGPSDNFRLVGDFSTQPVPEPSTLTLVVIAGLAISCSAGRLRTGSVP